MLWSKKLLPLDPLKTKRGFLHLKAYRLTPQAVALYKDNDFGAEAIKTHHLSFENLYQVQFYPQFFAYM